MIRNTVEIRQMFLDFFYSKGHKILETSSLIPHNDATLLFTNSGMNQFKNVFLGLEKFPYQRVTTAQNCIRVDGKHNDLNNVGYTTYHHTFFEMLGNFSFGDYFKHEALHFSWELLTSSKYFNLPKNKLLVTVYFTDDDTYNIWANEIGIPHKNIMRIGDKKNHSYVSDNFWQMGDTGPCGPCSEIFYDYGEHYCNGLLGNENKSNHRYIEIWNLVFMQFNRHLDGTIYPLPKPSVDTGMGLERISSILQNVRSNYDIDLFRKLIAVTAEITGTNDVTNISLRVIADHIRSCTFLIKDGIVPSNSGRGYVLRRIIRRAIRHGYMLGVKDSFFYKLVSPLFEVMDITSNQCKLQKSTVENIIHSEEEGFSYTLRRGLALLDYELTNIIDNTLNGDIAFRLHDTYGLQIDLIIDICHERNIKVDEDGFNHAMEEQRRRAKKSNIFFTDYNKIIHVNQSTVFVGYEKYEHNGQVIALFHNGKSVEIIHQGEEAIVILDETPFYAKSGGQVGDRGELKTSTGIFKINDTRKYGQAFGKLGKLDYGELKLGDKVISYVDREHQNRIRINHSATHLLHSALIRILGENIKQKGSLINDQYLRFDFSYHKSMISKQIYQIESIINQQIRRNLSIKTETMKLQEAYKKGAISLFNRKYEEQVRVLSIGDFSIELCGGLHVNRTGDIGLFRIISESGISSNIRRIEAVTGEQALSNLHSQDDLITNISKLVKGNKTIIIEKIQLLQDRIKKLEKKIKYLNNQEIIKNSEFLCQNSRDINGVKILINQVYNVDFNMLRMIVSNLKNTLKSTIIVIFTIVNGYIYLITGITKDLIDRIQAKEIIDNLSKKINGKSKSSLDLAQTVGTNINSLPDALKNLEEMFAKKLMK